MEHFDVSVCQRRRRAECLVSLSVLPECPHFTCSTEEFRLFQLRARVLWHLQNKTTLWSAEKLCVCVSIYKCVCFHPPLSCSYATMFSNGKEHSVHMVMKQLSLDSAVRQESPFGGFKCTNHVSCGSTSLFILPLHKN